MKKYLSVFVSLCLALASCSPEEPPVPELVRDNSVKVMGRELPIEQLLCKPRKIEYPKSNIAPAASEDGISLTVMADGANVKIELPLRLIGEKIKFLPNVILNPNPTSVYYTFHLSTRGEEAIYCRMLSWISGGDDDPHNDYNGWFCVLHGDNPDEYVFEWELTDQNGKDVSTGYVAGAFEPLT
ncbi:MAG: hypothetical protein LBV32_01910 [Tannerellaceae bacterium]|jgi:hypothetical protein|nr:hypothetical protein [Tannerellaceae bacterium]